MKTKIRLTLLEAVIIFFLLGLVMAVTVLTVTVTLTQEARIKPVVVPAAKQPAPLKTEALN